MTEKKPQEKDSQQNRCDEDIALSWLAKNPDALQKHPELLANIQIAFEAENITSLHEKQIHLLRRQNLKLHAKLDSLVGLAGANQKMAFCLHALAGSLLKESIETLKSNVDIYPDTLATSQICGKVFKNFFPHLRFALCWLDSCNDSGTTSTIHLGRPIKSGDLRIAGLLHRIFSSGAPTCETLNNAQKIVLFGKPVSKLASTVVIPITCPDKKVPVAVLALGSADSRHFEAGMGTMFLMQLAGLIGLTATPPAESEKS